MVTKAQTSVKGLSALLMDDDPGIRAILARILDNAGMQIFEAGDITEGLSLTQSKRPHIVFADLNFEGKESGFDFLGRVKSNPDLCDIPVIVLSALKTQDSIQRAKESGACDFLSKPIDAALLLQKARKYLQDLNYLEVNVSPDLKIAAKIQVPCKVTAASLDGIMLECSVRFTPLEKVRFSSEICKALGIEGPFPILADSSAPSSKNGFQSELRFLGLTRAQLTALEEVIARWHT